MKLIVLKNLQSGFFSNFCNVVTWLVEADKVGGMDISVEWDRDCGGSWSYGHGENVWNLFFLPIGRSGSAYEETVVVSRNEEFLYKHFGGHERKCLRDQTSTGAVTTLEALADAYRKHVKILPAVTAKVEAFVWKHFSCRRRVIGVHIRHPWHYYDTLSNTADSEDVDFVLKALDPQQDRVFLATDMQHVADRFLSMYPGLVVVQEGVLRAGPCEQQIHHAAPESQRGPHLAEQVLVDTLLLSKTETFYGKVSNVSYGVKIFNPGIQFVLHEKGYRNLPDVVVRSK
jgi:hypothetical protein